MTATVMKSVRSMTEDFIGRENHHRSPVFLSC